MLVEEAKGIFVQWQRYAEINDKLRITFSVIPESFLPYPSSVLEEALNIVAKGYFDAGDYETSKAVRESIVSLLRYVEDEKAIERISDGWVLKDPELRALTLRNLKSARDSWLNFDSVNKHLVSSAQCLPITESSSPRAGDVQAQTARIAIYLGAVMLFLGAAPLPYAYYSLLRSVACAVFALTAFTAFQRGSKTLPWLYGALALLFNPIVKVHLPKELWAGVDVGSGLLLLATEMFLCNRKPFPRWGHT